MGRLRPERFLRGPAPDADTVFRISSMSKSFTAGRHHAAAGRGALALDDPPARRARTARGLATGHRGSDQVTVRQLLDHDRGLPGRRPWADRQQGLPLDDFAALLSGGVSFAWAPDTRFEYASIGYAILGRIITAVSGLAYPEFVRQRLLTRSA